MKTNGFIELPRRGQFCIDFLNDNGPTNGKLCWVDSNVCSYMLRELDGIDTVTAFENCRNVTGCRSFLPTLGYTEEEVNALCPNTTLNDQICNTVGFDVCGDPTDTSIFSTTPDCSNVHPCATGYCRTVPRVYPTPARHIVTYPNCTATAASSSSPSVVDGNGENATAALQDTVMNSTPATPQDDEMVRRVVSSSATVLTSSWWCGVLFMLL